MNNLEEAAFSHNISPNERQLIDSRLGQLLPSLEQLRAQSQTVAQESQRLVNPEQYAILNDIVDYNRKLLPVNGQSLHNVIEAEQELHASLTKLDKKLNKPNGVDKNIALTDIDRRCHHVQLTYIQKLEDLDFAHMHTIKKVDKTLQTSFNKIWIWILEVFYSVPSSKYFWEDFSRKALSKHSDGGSELRRKMIVFDVSKLSPMQAKELDSIITSDVPLLTDKMPPNDELRKFFDVLGMLNGLYEVTLQKSQQKMTSQLANDARVAEEERNAIVASQRLNAVKFDLMSDVQNLYLLIDSEFK